MCSNDNINEMSKQTEKNGRTKIVSVDEIELLLLEDELADVRKEFEKIKKENEKERVVVKEKVDLLEERIFKLEKRLNLKKLLRKTKN